MPPARPNLAGRIAQMGARRLLMQRTRPRNDKGLGQEAGHLAEAREAGVDIRGVSHRGESPEETANRALIGRLIATTQQEYRIHESELNPQRIQIALQEARHPAELIKPVYSQLNAFFNAMKEGHITSFQELEHFLIQNGIRFGPDRHGRLTISVYQEGFPGPVSLLFDHAFDPHQGNYLTTLTQQLKQYAQKGARQPVKHGTPLIPFHPHTQSQDQQKEKNPWTKAEGIPHRKAA
ncbi:MAG: hypothetical protein HY917_05310 [Candidatus Diapherotrites archaeon]|nr:hypothetical protein [Candidatus Diapherotrites archaeon]